MENDLFDLCSEEENKEIDFSDLSEPKGNEGETIQSQPDVWAAQMLLHLGHAKSELC